MTAQRWQQIKEIFDAALRCRLDQRSAFLADACGQDKPLRQEIETLLAAHEKSGTFIDSPAYQVAAGLLADDLVHEPVRESLFSRFARRCEYV